MPSGKLDCLLAVARSVNNEKNQLNGDELLAVFVYVLVKGNVMCEIFLQ